jgi:hypothetical protein
LRFEASRGVCFSKDGGYLLPGRLAEGARDTAGSALPQPAERDDGQRQGHDRSPGYAAFRSCGKAAAPLLR